MWAKYERDKWCYDPRRKRSTNGCLVSNRIPIEIDDEIEKDTRKKKCEIYQQPDHNRKICPNIPSFSAST